MDIPYPSQLTMSSNHLPAREMPFKCFRCCIAKKKKGRRGEGVFVCVGGGGGGGWVATGLRAQLKPIQFLCDFFACVVVVFVWFGGVRVGWRPAGELR